MNRACQRHRADAIGAQQHNPSPLDMFLRPVAIADDRSQSLSILVAENNTDGLCHDPSIAWLQAAVNPMFTSVH